MNRSTIAIIVLAVLALAAIVAAVYYRGKPVPGDQAFALPATTVTPENKLLESIRQSIYTTKPNQGPVQVIDLGGAGYQAPSGNGGGGISGGAGSGGNG